MEAWEQLHVSLLHRSKFFVAFKGRETFFYEAEHRRLVWLRDQLGLVAEEDDPAVSFNARKGLEKAKRKLEVHNYAETIHFTQ